MAQSEFSRLVENRPKRKCPHGRCDGWGAAGGFDDICDCCDLPEVKAYERAIREAWWEIYPPARAAWKAMHGAEKAEGPK